MQTKILSVGMAACDITLNPIPADILEIDNWIISPPVAHGGGDALNVAVALGKLGADVALCSRIGQDWMADIIMAQLKESGVNTTHMIRDEKASTATRFVLVDEKGERHFASAKAIYSRFDVNDVPYHVLHKAGFIHFGSAMQLSRMDDGGIERLFREARRLGKCTVMDASLPSERQRNRHKNWANALSGALYQTDYFLPGQTEAEYISKETQPEKQADFFWQFGLKAYIVKLGSKGCFVTDYKRQSYLPPPAVSVKDTNGAGDCFTAGFILALSHGWDVFEAAAFANAAAALSITKEGAAGGLTGYSDVMKLYKSS